MPVAACNRRQIAVAVAGQDHPAGLRGRLQVAGDPLGRHQGRDGDRQHVDRVVEADCAASAGDDRPQRVLGQAAGDEMNVLAQACAVTRAESRR